MLDLLGPKTEADMAKPDKKAKQPKAPAQGSTPKGKKEDQKKKEEEEEAGAASIVELMKKVNFHKPGENYKTDG